MTRSFVTSPWFTEGARRSDPLTWITVRVEVSHAENHVASNHDRGHG
jgi:hypothetical protein